MIASMSNKRRVQVRISDNDYQMLMIKAKAKWNLDKIQHVLMRLIYDEIVKND